jgi:flagellar biosynthesis protein FlhF
MAFRRSSSRLADPSSAGAASASAHNMDPRPQSARPAGDPSTAIREWPSDEKGFLTEVFRSHALPASLIERLLGYAMAPAHAPRPVDRLAIALAAHFNFLPVEDALRAPILLYGLPGAGVTTLAAKLAARFDERQVLVIATEASGAGATAQLEEYLEVLGLPLAVASDAAALRSTVASADGRMVIIDGGSVTPGDAASAKRIGGLIDAARAQGMLVLPADAGSDEAATEASAAAQLGTRRMIVTKLDTVRYLGSALVAADIGKLALVGASITPQYAFGLRNLTPENLARRLTASALRAERWRAAPL